VTSPADIPSYDRFEPAILRVLAAAGGSLKRTEIRERTIAEAGITDDQLALTFPEGTPSAGRSIVLNRIGWAISHLKLMGAADNSQRGVWSITSRGRELLAQGEDAISAANRDARTALRARRGQTRHFASDEPGDAVDDEALMPDEEDTWKGQLLSVLTSMAPDAFERLCARLLREIGCRDVEVTRYSDDEGLDGTGVLEVSLLSFPVFFQAKRYQPGHAVQPNKIREFRGAMAHRGDKGFFITTGLFTARAQDEARRSGAPIDLIDGDRLCDLLRENNLGVELQPVVNKGFFAAI
jgi:restriction system protein